MSRRNSVFAYLFLIGLAIFGAWLNGQFTGSVESLSFLRLFSGLVIMIGALVGIVLLIRRGLRPMDKRELAVWGVVRGRGKRSYIRSAALKGVLFGLVSISWPIINDLRKARLTSDSLLVCVALFLTCVFGMCYAAIRIWDANEKAYEVLAPPVPQHNNGVRPTPHPEASRES